MQTFAAIDFETANSYPSSVCSVGVVIVRGGEFVERFYSLIQPEPYYYDWCCQRVHGLSERTLTMRRCFRMSGKRLHHISRAYRWWLTMPCLTKDASRLPSGHIRWITRIMSSTTRWPSQLNITSEYSLRPARRFCPSKLYKTSPYLLLPWMTFV